MSQNSLFELPPVEVQDIPVFIPRDYQVECLNAIRNKFREGVNRQLLVKATGCHARGQLLIMFDGSLKRVEDVQVGDQLMGPDSTARNVLSLARGREQMVRVVPVKGESWVVNQSHILSLQRSYTKGQFVMGDVIDISIPEYRDSNKHAKHNLKLFRVPIEFQQIEDPPIDPYFIGIMLGDGMLTKNVAICNPEPEIEEYVRSIAQQFDLNVKEFRSGGDCKSFKLIRKIGSPMENPIQAIFRKIGIAKTTAYTKSIPRVYKLASREKRLELLAGLLDTDGHFSGGSYDYITASATLADDIAFVCRSLGLSAYISKQYKYCQLGTGGLYHRLTISGDLNAIPCKVPRKKAPPRQQIKSVLRTGFTLEDLTEDDYYGFELDGDKRYLLGDFTVTHNTGKGSLVAMLPRFFRLGKERLSGKKMLFVVHRKELLDDIANRIALNNPTLKIGIEQEKNWADPDCDIVCASVQTIGINSGNRKQVGDQLDDDGIYSGAASTEAGTAVAPEVFSNKRIERWNPDDFSIVVVDEAHHITGQTYQNILKYFQVLKKDPAANNPRKLLCGFSATPGRADNMGLDGYFQEITYELNIRQAIQRNILVGISAFTVSTEVSLDDIKVKQGELEVKELSRTVNTLTRNNLVVDKYIEHGKDLPGLGFCVDVQHAEDLALLFRERGISAEAVSYRTPKEDRKRIIEDYKALKIKVLCSATLLSEGFDSASATVAMLARPTKSRILYTQCLSSDTEVLTDQGWIGIDAIGSDIGRVATFNMVDARIEFQVAENVFSRPVNEGEKMVGIESPHLSIRVTDGHDMVYKCSTWTSRNWRKEPAGKLAIRKSNHEIPIAGNASFPGCDLKEFELELIGFWHGDGSHNKITNAITFTQSERFPDRVQWVRTRLEQCNFKFGEYSQKRTGSWAQYDNSKLFSVSFGMPRPADSSKTGYARLSAWLDKSLPSIYDTLTRDQMLALMRGYFMADGSKTERIYWNRKTETLAVGSSKQRASRLQALLVTRGIRCNIVMRHPQKDSISKQPIWLLYYNTNKTVAKIKGSTSTEGTRWSIVDPLPDEKVWCMTVPNGTLVTRRNGKVAILGNCIGRVLRPFPSPEYAEQLAAQGQTPPFVKESAIVIDIVDVCSRHNLNTVNTLLGIPPKMKMNGEKAMAVAEEVEKIMAKQPGLKLDTISSLKELKAMSERIDLFSTPEIPDAVKKVSTMAWLPQGVGTFVLNIPKSSDPRDPDSLIVRENALGQFDVLRSKNGIRVPVSTETDLKSALSRAEKDVPTNVAGMMSIEAAWRNTTPSDKQITLYASLYPERRRAFSSPELFREFVRKSMKKGDLSNLIAARNGRRR